METNQVEPKVELSDADPKATEATVETVETQKPTQEEITQKIKEELAKEFKAELAGLNRKNSELENKLKEEAKAKMSEEEKIKAERDEMIEETKLARLERDQYKRKNMVDQALAKVDLPLEFASRVNGNTVEEIEADVAIMKSYIDSRVQTNSESEVNKRLAGSAPKIGDKANPDKLTLEEISALPKEERSALLKKMGY